MSVDQKLQRELDSLSAYPKVHNALKGFLNDFGIGTTQVIPPAPKRSAPLTSLSVEEILALRDALLLFRSALVNELCMCRAAEIPAEAQAKLIWAKQMRAKQADGSNAETRKALVETDPGYISANSDYLLLRSTRLALDGKLEQIDLELEAVRDAYFLKSRYAGAQQQTAKSEPPSWMSTPKPLAIRKAPPAPVPEATAASAAASEPTPVPAQKSPAAVQVRRPAGTPLGGKR